jgi:hypothetical protein
MINVKHSTNQRAPRNSPIIIKNKDRATYYDVLDIAHTTMNYEPFIKLVSELVIESEKLWLSVLD